MNHKTTTTRFTTRIMAAVLALSVTGGASTYAQPQPYGYLQVTSQAAVTSTQGNNASLMKGPQSTKELEGFLDAFFAQDQIKEQASGVAISVVRDGKVLISKGYGHSNNETNTPVSAKDTTFRIASISKVFTAAAAMQLIEQGKLSLKDNIEKYLNGYKLTNPFESPVTIEHLLTHTTGFESVQPSDASYLFDPSIQPITLKESIFEAFPRVIREPGSSYMYDNFASRLLGFIVEQVSQESFGSYVQKHILKPLGMTSSSFTLTSELSNKLASSYDPEGGAIPEYDLSPREWPEGSMVSTASDMAIFMQAFLNNGRASNGEVILSPESIKAMSTYKVAIHSAMPDMTYGFESPVEPSKMNGEHVISKGGDIIGFSSLLWMLPDQNTGVFLTYNANSELRNELFSAFMDHYYEGNDVNSGQPDFKAYTKQELTKFEGLYSDLRIKFLTKVEATGDGILTVSDVSGSYKLKQVSELLFKDELGKPLAFKQDKDGRITDLKYLNLFSYVTKLPASQMSFPDVAADHPYASYISALKFLDILKDDPNTSFEPQQAVTRGAFVHTFNALWGIQASSNPSLFTDIDASSYRGDIQAAAESGLLSGTGNGLFEPDRPILREEAAVIAFRLLAGNGIRMPDATLKLASGTSEWAVEAVSSAISWKLHGPEVNSSSQVIDFGSQKAMSKQELAAFLFTMLLPAE